MSAWAGLAGGAQGVLGAWDDNREAIKEQAKRDFQVTLEETRMNNTRALRDEDRKYSESLADKALQDEEVRLGNERAAAMEERAYQSSEKDKDRKSTERAAALKAGNSADSSELKYVKSQIKRMDAVLKDEYASEGDKKAAKQELKALDAQHRRLSGVAARDLPTPTANDMEAMRRKDMTIEQFENRYGVDAAAMAANQLELEKQADADKKAAEIAAKEKEGRQKVPTLSDEFPSQEKGLLASVAGVVKDVAGTLAPKETEALKNKTSAALERVSAAIESGDRARGEDINLLEAMYHQPWLSDEKRAIIREAYKRAKGH